MKAKRIVVKVGTSTLTYDSGRLISAESTTCARC